MAYRSSLGKKMLCPIVAIIALGLAVVLVVFHLNARNVVQQALTKRLQREAHLTARLLDNWVQARMTDVVNWSEQEVLAEALVEDGYYGKSAIQGAASFLDSVQKGYPYFDSIFLANARGEAIASSSSDYPMSNSIVLADRPYFKEAMQGKTVVSEVLVSRLSGNRVFTITTPIAVKKQFVGVVSVVVDFARFQALFLDEFRLKQYGYAFLTDKQQRVMASSGDNEIPLSDPKNADFLQRIAASDSGLFIHRLDGKETLTAFQHLHWADWSFNINQSLDDTLQPLARIAQVSAVGAVVVLFCISWFIIHLFRALIAKRLHDMLKVIGDIKIGQFAQRIPQPPVRADEITELTDSFNGMIEQLEHTLKTLHGEIEVRKNAEAVLADHQDNLEKIIEQRGAELKKEILERQRAEERLVRAEKLEMIGALAGGVAHDLNNILSGIVSYPDLLLLKLPPDSPLARPLRTIKESGEKAAAIVQDLLTLARRGVTVKVPVNLNELIEAYLRSPEFALLRANHPGVRVTTDCSPDLFHVLGSPVHLSKTIMNLVINAAEAMEHGGLIRIATENRYVDNSLRLYEKIGQGEYVVLEVADQGSGIKPEDIDKIFEPFYTSKKMGKSGTGLGMAVVWGTVKDHLGYVNCESRVGVGSTFTIYLPVTSQVCQRQLQESSLEDCQGQGEHILVVDDVEEQREIAAAILLELGYRVTTAASGEEAVMLAARERFDLLLLDMILGEGMDGLAAYRAILVHAPGQRAIITSGFSETERIAEAMRLGVGQYIKKPYMIAKLGRAIREELEKS